MKDILKAILITSGMVIISFIIAFGIKAIEDANRIDYAAIKGTIEGVQYFKETPLIARDSEELSFTVKNNKGEMIAFRAFMHSGSMDLVAFSSLLRAYKYTRKEIVVKPHMRKRGVSFVYIKDIKKVKEK